MEYKSWRTLALLLQVELIPSQQGWEKRQLRWEGLGEGQAQQGSAGQLVQLPTAEIQR